MTAHFERGLGGWGARVSIRVSLTADFLAGAQKHVFFCFSTFSIIFNLFWPLGELPCPETENLDRNLSFAFINPGKGP